MLDLIFIGTLVGFFAVALLLVRLCESMVTLDPASSSSPTGLSDTPHTAERSA